VILRQAEARSAQARAALLPRQQALAEGGGIVVAGRDIGTVVLPRADLKLFLDASVEERAARRIQERGLDPAGDEAEAVRAQLRERDEQDRNRAVAPLRAADDAVVIETDGNTFERTVGIVVAAIRNVESAIGPRATAPVDPPPKPERAPARSAVGDREPGPVADRPQPSRTRLEPTPTPAPAPVGTPRGAAPAPAPPPGRRSWNARCGSTTTDDADPDDRPPVADRHAPVRRRPVRGSIASRAGDR
jgi:cytidylate kinase